MGRRVTMKDARVKDFYTSMPMMRVRIAMMRDRIDGMDRRCQRWTPSWCKGVDPKMRVRIPNTENVRTNLAPPGVLNA